MFTALIYLASLVVRLVVVAAPFYFMAHDHNLTITSFVLSQVWVVVAVMILFRPSELSYSRKRHRNNSRIGISQTGLGQHGVVLDDLDPGLPINR